MATLLKAQHRVFEETPNRMEPFKILTDTSRIRKGVEPEHLNFDWRQLRPGEYSAPYHFHRFAEELFLIFTGSATLRTPDGLVIVKAGDVLFFEKGETGAHQLYNHTSKPCIYLDIRTYFGYDVAEFPDSDKVFIAPSREIYRKGDQVDYFDGEINIGKIWAKLRNKVNEQDENRAAI